MTTCSLEEKYEQVRQRYRFYIDVHDESIARTLSKRIEDLGLHQEVFLTNQVSHVIQGIVQPVRAPAPWTPREGFRTRADAMLQRIQTDIIETQPKRNYVTLTVQKAVLLLDKIYDTFFSSPRKANVRHFTKHYIKIEFLDKVWRPVFKEFDEWPVISLAPESPAPLLLRHPVIKHDLNLNKVNIGQRMTRKSRPRLKEREDKAPKAGYCEMCNADYTDATLHRRSPHHLAFVRDHTNFLALDTLITAGADVATFLEKTTPPINGERRSQRKCNGDVTKTKQSPDSTVNGHASPKANGIEEEKRPNKRCSKRNCEDEGQYYKVIGVSTKLRSSGNFPAKQKESPPVNGTKPLVVKFRKVRRSELSVLSDEAEQFMFPKRASSTSSTSCDDDEEEEKVKTPEPPQPPPSLERRRLARPMALKEESSEEDSWPEDKRRRRRKVVPVVKKTRRFPSRMLPPPSPKPEEPVEDPPPDEVPEQVSPLREEPVESCMKWEDGKLKYTPAVEQLEFAFESVPHSEPWFETFKRQDEDRTVKRNVPNYFSLYTKSPKLPYEIGQLPPLKHNCCALSELVKRDDKAGPSRSYGTRGMKLQKIKKRTLALLALESHPRKSPREHASTLAILGSTGIKRRNGDDTKSTASEDTMSETQCPIVKTEPIKTETQDQSERLQQFLSEVFDDASDYEMPEDNIDGDENVATSTNAPDILNLVSECDNCDMICQDLRERIPPPKPKGRRSKFKKKNRTGWPATKKGKKGDSRTNSTEDTSNPTGEEQSLPDDTSQDTISECNESGEKTEENSRDCSVATDEDDDKPLKVKLDEEDTIKETIKEETKPNLTETEEEKIKANNKKRVFAAMGDWLQPIVRVARVDPIAARKLRSAGVKRKYRKR